MGVRGELLVRVEDLAPFEVQWDALAVANRRPYCAPAWSLAWWRHVASARARLRVVAVTDGDELIGLAPFFVETPRRVTSRYRLLGCDVAAPVEPLARPGREDEVASAVASALAACEPRPDVVALDGVPAESPWPWLLARAWPGPRRPWKAVVNARAVPVVDLREPDFDAWFAGRRPRVRRQLRRYRRRVDDLGGRFRLVDDPAEVPDRLEAFARMHEERWEERGGSAALRPGVLLMLADVGAALASTGRFRLWCLEAREGPVSAQLFLNAGEQTSYWLGGFDERWSRYSPGILTILAAIEDAATRGDRCLDLGPGAQPYKYRLADRERTFEWLVLVPPGPRAPLARAASTGERAARRAYRRLPPATQEKLQRVFMRGRRLFPHGRGARARRASVVGRARAQAAGPRRLRSPR